MVYKYLLEFKHRTTLFTDSCPETLVDGCWSRGIQYPNVYTTVVRKLWWMSTDPEVFKLYTILLCIYNSCPQTLMNKHWRRGIQAIHYTIVYILQLSPNSGGWALTQRYSSYTLYYCAYITVVPKLWWMSTDAEVFKLNTILLFIY